MLYTVEIEGQEYDVELSVVISGQKINPSHHHPGEDPEVEWDIEEVKKGNESVELTADFEAAVRLELEKKSDRIYELALEKHYESRDPEREYDDHLLHRWY